MKWFQIALPVAAFIGVIAIVYQYVKLRRYLKSNEEKTVEQAEPQIRRYMRNAIIWMVITCVFVIASIVNQSASFIGELLRAVP